MGLLKLTKTTRILTSWCSSMRLSGLLSSSQWPLHRRQMATVIAIHISARIRLGPVNIDGHFLVAKLLLPLPLVNGAGLHLFIGTSRILSLSFHRLDLGLQMTRLLVSTARQLLDHPDLELLPLLDRELVLVPAQSSLPVVQTRQLVQTLVQQQPRVQPLPLHRLVLTLQHPVLERLNDQEQLKVGRTK